MNFSLRLKELREKKQISQKQLAIDLGVGIASVGMWESSDRTPPAKKLKTIADYFGVSVDYLLGREPVTPEERAAGWIDKKKASITPEEEDLLEIYRDIGRKYGKDGQRSYIAVGESMLNTKK